MRLDNTCWTIPSDVAAHIAVTDNSAIIKNPGP